MPSHAQQYNFSDVRCPCCQRQLEVTFWRDESVRRDCVRLRHDDRYLEMRLDDFHHHYSHHEAASHRVHVIENMARQMSIEMHGTHHPMQTQSVNDLDFGEYSYAMAQGKNGQMIKVPIKAQHHLSPFGYATSSASAGEMMSVKPSSTFASFQQKMLEDISAQRGVPYEMLVDKPKKQKPAAIKVNPPAPRAPYRRLILT